MRAIRYRQLPAKFQMRFWERLPSYGSAALATNLVQRQTTARWADGENLADVRRAGNSIAPTDFGATIEKSTADL